MRKASLPRVAQRRLARAPLVAARGEPPLLDGRLVAQRGERGARLDQHDQALCLRVDDALDTGPQPRPEVFQVRVIDQEHLDLLGRRADLRHDEHLHRDSAAHCDEVADLAEPSGSTHLVPDALLELFYHLRAFLFERILVAFVVLCRLRVRLAPLASLLDVLRQRRLRMAGLAHRSHVRAVRDEAAAAAERHRRRCAA